MNINSGCKGIYKDNLYLKLSSSRDNSETYVLIETAWLGIGTIFHKID